MQEVSTAHLKPEFEHINYVEGEDLNMERAVLKIIKSYWYNVQKYRSVGDIAKATCLTERSIYKVASKNGWEVRIKIRKNRISMNNWLIHNCLHSDVRQFMIGLKQYTVQIAQNGCRYVMVEEDGKMFEYIVQNPTTQSHWAKRARDGERITWKIERKGNVRTSGWKAITDDDKPNIPIGNGESLVK